MTMAQMECQGPQLIKLRAISPDRKILKMSVINRPPWKNTLRSLLSPAKETFASLRHLKKVVRAAPYYGRSSNLREPILEARLS